MIPFYGFFRQVILRKRVVLREVSINLEQIKGARFDRIDQEQ